MAFSSSSSSSKKTGHDAFTLVDVTEVSEKISSMTYVGDLLYVGTACGKLLLYRVKGSTSAQSGKTAYQAERVHCVDVVKKGAVTQVEAVPDNNLLIALADGALSLFDLDTLRRRPPGLLDQKGVVSFTLNVRGFLVKHKLCVCVSGSSKKRLKLYEWSGATGAGSAASSSSSGGGSGGGGGSDLSASRGGQYAFLKELDLPDVPKAISYFADRLFLGYSREYNILWDETGEVQDLFSSSAASSSSSSSGSSSSGSSGGGLLGGSKDTAKPVIKYLPGDRFLIVTADRLGIVLTPKGEPATVPHPSFEHHPLSLAYCYPYLISVSDCSTKMEVHASRASGGRLFGAGGTGAIGGGAGVGGGLQKDEIIQTIEVPLGAVGELNELNEMRC